MPQQSWALETQLDHAQRSNSETVSLLAELTGLRITLKDQPKLQRYIQQRMQALGLTAERQFCDRIRDSYRHRRQGDEWSQLVDQMTNGESYFFRDPLQLQLIREKLLPELVDLRRRSVRDGLANQLYLNLWSAGCSTGEEPYSLAMMLKEQLFDFDRWKINLIATDINPSAIAAARAGLYRDWSLRQVRPSDRAQYFRSVDTGWEIARDLRTMVQWDVLNLSSPDAIARRIPWASMDLILCRNVFIYFEASAIARTLEQFRMSLSQDGYLLVGHSELEGQNLQKFRVSNESGSAVYRRPLEGHH